MDSSSTSSLNELHWEEVLAPAGKVGSESLYLNRLLQFLCQENELSGAALYFEAEEGFKRQASCGRGDYPMTLASDADLPRSHFKLPGGLLVYASEASAPVDLSGPWALALTSAQQATILGRHLKQQSFVVNYRGVELEALYDVGLAIASMLNLEGLGEEALLRAVSLLDARRGALYLRDGEHFVLDHTFGGEAAAELPLDDPQVQSLLEDRLQGKQDLLPEAKFLMALPIGTSRDPQGLLLVGDKESRQGVGRFKDSDRRTLALFANQVAIALETAHLHRQALEKERLERELDLAADIQRGLLPDELPQVEGYEVAGWSRSARHVGGDYYDLLTLGDGRVAAVLADVSGKGMPAALLVSTIHSAVRLLIRQSEVGPKLIEDLNQHVSESSATNRFITLFVAELDSKRNRIDYVNAGHNPVLMIRASGKVDLLHSGGLPVGLFENSAYEQGSVAVGPGDLLCAYSDGITECLSPMDEEYGLNRLTDLVCGMQGEPLDEIVSAVSRAVTDYAGGQAQGDDQTLLVLRRKAQVSLRPATG